MRETAFSNWILFEYQTLYKSLPIYRIVYVFLVFTVVLPKYLWISNYPDTFFLPRVSFTMFFSNFPDATFFYLLIFLLILSLLALLVGYKTFYSSLAVALFLFIGNGWEYSFGKVNHDIVLILIPLLLAFCSWGEKEAKSGTQSQYYISVIPIFALLLALAMLTAAWAKISTGWLDPNVAALPGHLVRNYFVAGRETITASLLLSQGNFQLFKALDYGTIIIETAFILSIFSLKYFRLVCAFACLFHLGVQLSLGISFMPNIIAYGLFVNWGYLKNFDRLEALQAKLQPLSQHIGIVTVSIVSIPIWVIYSTFGNPFSMDLGLTYIFGANLIKTFFMLTAVAISLRYIFELFGGFLQSFRLGLEKQKA